jgi:hypothetical protein
MLENPVRASRKRKGKADSNWLGICLLTALLLFVLISQERQRKQGREVRPDTKYTGRKRPTPF